MKKLTTLTLLFLALNAKKTIAQDTFSMCAIDTITGEIGSCGASCVDLQTYFPTYQNDFISEIIPTKGVINTQASYNTTNQTNARNQMNAGSTPSQIITWLKTNDVASNPAIRQYGVVAFTSPGHLESAVHTGTNCMSYANHIIGPNYCIQGNILLGQKVLDSMEARFNREQGNLACKLMAALQGAKMIGADTRCTSNGSSSLFAFLKVSKPIDTFGNPSFKISVRTLDGANIEPIDSLQIIFNQSTNVCTSLTGIKTLDSKLSNLTLAPNPFNESIEIKLDKAFIQKIEIINSIGEIKESITCSKETKSVVLTRNNLEAGNYICILTDEKGNYYHAKLLVQ